MDRATRSRMMSGIRGKDTLPERQVRSALSRRGFRFRLHVKALPGRPDLVLRKWKTVIQVQGCFWHGHARCRYFKRPGSRKKFWREKIDANRVRDRRALKALEDLGWRWIVVWECALRDDPDRALRLVVAGLRRRSGCVEIRSTRRRATLVVHGRPAVRLRVDHGPA